MHTFAEKGDENKTSLMCLGAIEPLSRLISHEDKTAVVSLGVMASNNSGFSESSGRAATKCPPPLLLELLRSDFPVIQQLALRTIENITTDSESRVGFRNVQGFDRILEILRPKEFSDLHEGALRVILNCLQMMGGLEQLLQFVGTSTHIQGIYLYLHVRIRTLKVHFSTLRQQITTLKGAYLYFKCL
uniref:Armadillo repeat containing 3 n=1 Tax=Cyprinus carpio carpio TaxID=630221 RepID=A0A9J8BRL8_CYPCA